MRLHGSRIFWQTIKAGCVVVGITLAASNSYAQSNSPFNGLEGSWSGTGNILTDSGGERIRCRANYTVAAAGNNLQQSIRCASDSYRFELSSDINNRGGNLTGTWKEASRSINGGIEGRVNSKGQFDALVTANGFVAELKMTTNNKRQIISIASQNAQLRGVNITLAR